MQNDIRQLREIQLSALYKKLGTRVRKQRSENYMNWIQLSVEGESGFWEAHALNIRFNMSQILKI